MTAQAPGQPPLPLRDVRKLLPGYSVRYQPREAQGGEVALLVAGAASQEFLVLPQKPATAEASWTLPVRASLVAVVYGPGGLDRKKVGQLVKRDPGLVSQLADYAEQTAQTEAIIERLTSPRTPASATWDAALAGFATRYGVPATALDPRAPFEQQAHVLLRAINPALSSYDPLQPEPRLRMQQSAGLAASVAGLFFGNSVGLAAGGASLLLNLRSLLLPNTEFRSSFAQLDPHSPAVVSLCAKREAARSRTRMAYLWAHRLVDSDAPALSLGGLAAVPAGVKSALPLTADDDQLAALLRDWQLERIDGSTSVAVPVRLAPDTRRAEIDLSQVTLAPGAFRLTAAWDWTRVAVDGVLQVEEIPRNFDVKGALVAGGENRISLAAPTLRYLESVSLKAGQTEFAGSWDGGVVRWSAPLPAGPALLTVRQQGGVVVEIPVRVLPPHPALSGLPLRANLGEEAQVLTIAGKGLDRIEAIETEAGMVELGAGRADVRLAPRTTVGLYDLRLRVEGLPEPLVLPSALRVAGPRPRIEGVRFALPRTTVSLRPAELPAGAPVTFEVKAVHAEGAAVRLRCGARTVDARVSRLSPGALFFTATMPDAGCSLEAEMETGEGVSCPHVLGRVVRLPRLQELAVSGEALSEGVFAGSLRGLDLELIARTGWNGRDGLDVTALPSPAGHEQALDVPIPWPSPAPRAPLYIWLRGDSEGRRTELRY